MAYLAAAVALLGAVAVVNLLLTVGVVRRLREQTAELAALRGAGGGESALPAGAPVGDFAAESATGRPVTRATLEPRTLAGFFSPGCQPCAELLPGFLAHARSRPGGPAGVLAVVVDDPGDPAGTAATVQRLRPVATVVVEPGEGPVQQAFGVTGFPTVALVEDGVVAASGYALAAVAERDVPAVPAAG